ncbi:hypothetical protein Scep_019317 [Stephania cephalantha]|uniref:Uncharacterized protein n=1 Tax=Stephania cephalantha TaxID=152367 RepID=A0AAP0IAZ6_9MAGN
MIGDGSNVDISHSELAGIIATTSLAKRCHFDEVSTTDSEENMRESWRFARIGCLVNQCFMVEVRNIKSQLDLELKTSIEGMV